MTDGLRTPIASEFRRQRRLIERTNRRLALVDIPGKVIAGSQDQGARTMRLDLGRSADGRVVKGPRVPWAEAAAGTLRVHAPPKDGQQFRLRSPSGTVGTASIAEAQAYDEDTGAPSNRDDEAVLEFGSKSRITLRDGRIELRSGRTVLAIGEDGITIDGADMAISSAIDVFGPRLTHNGADVGSSHTHPGVRRGPDRTDGPE